MTPEERIARRYCELRGRHLSNIDDALREVEAFYPMLRACMEEWERERDARREKNYLGYDPTHEQPCKCPICSVQP